MQPGLYGFPFVQVSSSDNAFLTSPFTIEEIKETVWSCDGNKSPGLDGFNLNFFKNCWDTLKEEVYASIQ